VIGGRAQVSGKSRAIAFAGEIARIVDELRAARPSSIRAAAARYFLL
jgi:hypothetical protein